MARGEVRNDEGAKRAEKKGSRDAGENSTVMRFDLFAHPSPLSPEQQLRSQLNSPKILTTFNLLKL